MKTSRILVVVGVLTVVFLIKHLRTSRFQTNQNKLDLPDQLPVELINWTELSTAQDHDDDDNDDDDDHKKEEQSRRYAYFHFSIGNSHSLKDYFDSNYHTFGRGQNWTIHGYEIDLPTNSNMDKILHEIRTQMPGSEIYLNVNTLAWTHNGTLELGVKRNGSLGDEWSLWNNSTNYETRLTVTCADVIPVLKRYSKDDFIAVRMDLAGFEYDLLLQFLKRDVLGLIDYLSVKFHPNQSDLHTPEDVFQKILQIHGVQ